MNETNKLKISVWAAYDGDAPFIMAAPGGEGADPIVRELPRFASGLHREVYSWQTTEDVLGGVVDPEHREALSEALFIALHPVKAPSERGVDVLAEFVARARAALAEDRTEWSASDSSSDDDGVRRLNPLLALVTHLEWLVAVHDGQPNISITAR